MDYATYIHLLGEPFQQPLNKHHLIPVVIKYNQESIHVSNSETAP